MLVSFLPEKYSGPLKMGDRIVALDGRPIENAQKLSRADGEVHRGAAGRRDCAARQGPGPLETFVAHAEARQHRDGRVQGQYLPAEREMQIVSRTIKEMRVTIPPQWAQDSRLFWNGLALEKIEAPAVSC